MGLDEILQCQPVWRAACLAHAPTGILTGFAALDAALPGHGWPANDLTEIHGDAQGIGELQLVLPAVAAEGEPRDPDVDEKQNDRHGDREDCEVMPVGVAFPAGHGRDQKEQYGEADEAQGDQARPAVEIPAAAEGEREAQDEEEVADDATGERAAHDLGQPVVHGEERDDELGRIAERRIEEASDPGARVVGRVLGRLPDQPGEWDEGQRGEHEELDVAGAQVIGQDAKRPEREKGEQDFADHGRGTLTFTLL